MKQLSSENQSLKNLFAKTNENNKIKIETLTNQIKVMMDALIHLTNSVTEKSSDSQLYPKYLSSPHKGGSQYNLKEQYEENTISKMFEGFTPG